MVATWKVALCILGLAQSLRVSPKSAKKTVSLSETDGMDALKKRLQNPAGCAANIPEKFGSADYPSMQTGGFFPVEDFKTLLATREGDFEGRKGQGGAGRWCPEPSDDLVPRDPKMLEYLKEALKGTDSSKPIIMAVTDVHPEKDYHRIGILNFICGLKRLGVGNQTLIFTLSQQSQQTIQKEHPELRVMWSPELAAHIKTSGLRTGMEALYTNRVAKLAIADLLVHLDREVIMSDLDAHWTQDPAPMLQAMTNSQGKPLDFAAMKDLCWLELNSGFLYYRPTNITKELLRLSLQTVRAPRLLSDNDQYLLNCGLARAAIKGLNYKILPTDSFPFCFHGDMMCHSSYAGFTQKYDQNDPMVWHTAEFTTSYQHKIDSFVALNAIDFDAKTGQCLPGQRGSKEDVKAARLARHLNCDTGPNGIIHADCRGSCTPAPERAQKLLQEYQAGDAPDAPGRSYYGR
jgi:hypothetical protein